MQRKTKALGQQKSRRTSTAGYARGEETRLRVINIAIAEFGERGFRGASLRVVAAKAGVAAPVLHYYFEGKRGLYLACIEHINRRARQLLFGVHEQAHKQLDLQVNRTGRIEIVCSVYERSVDYIFRTPERVGWFRFMSWDSGDPLLQKRCQSAQRDIYDEFRRLMLDLIARITGKGTADMETRIRALTLGGQLAVFALSPEYCRQQLDGSDMDDEDLKVLKAVIRQQTAAALRGASTQMQQ